MRKRKLNLLLIIFVIILVLGIGYAYLTTTLSINGTTDVDANTWNVFWDNVQVTEGSVSASTPVIDTNKTTVTFSVHLSKPGDFYEFTVDAKNTGTIDAMIDTITKTTTIPNYLNYTVTYDDDREVYTKQYLKANKTEKLKVRVDYKSDVNASDLPSTAQTLNLSFGTNYVQADDTAQTRLLYYWCSSDTRPPVYQETKPNRSNYILVENGNGTMIRGTLYTRIRKNSTYYNIELVGGDGGAAFEENKQKLRNLCPSEYYDDQGSEVWCYGGYNNITINNNGLVSDVDNEPVFRIGEDKELVCYSMVI